MIHIVISLQPETHVSNLKQFFTPSFGLINNNYKVPASNVSAWMFAVLRVDKQS